MTRFKSGLLALVALGAVTGAALADSAAPRKVAAIMCGGWRDDYYPRFGCVNVYDVTEAGEPNYSMKDSLMFSVWLGFEITTSSNKEELVALTVNPVNGTVYVITYDSGTAGGYDALGNDGTAIQWSGTLSSNGQDYPVGGSLSAPARVSLTLTETNPEYGQVVVEPEQLDANNLEFHEGTPVTLTAVAVEGKHFQRWEVFDPNYPGDANHATIDTNATLAFVIDEDTSVNAVWGCGNGGAGLFLPLSLAALALLSRRKA